MAVADLREEWATCFGVCADCDAVFSELAAAYGRNDPGYHTIEHAFEVVEALNALHTEIGSTPTPEEQLAAWCHDVIYVPRAADNEERSARFAADAARALHWSEARVGRVIDLVLGTAHGDKPTPGQALLADADFSPLAKRWSEYVLDVERLRRESEADDAGWLQSRRRVVERFLATPTIFSSPTAIQLWEQSARENLERELTLMKVSIRG